MVNSAVFNAPPQHVPTSGIPDGPLLGNGDVGVVLAGPPEAQTFYIGKINCWTRHPANAKTITVGRVESGEHFGLTRERIRQV